MSMNLVEAAKSMTGDTHRAAVIEMFPRSSDILRVIPFDNIGGNALKYDREETLPGIGFRGINEAYSEGVGVINPVTESLYILGGDMDVDRQIVKQFGPAKRAAHVALKVKAAAGKWTKTFLKGDTGTEPREFDGLQSRLTGSQVISAGTTAGGAALSLAKLDELIDAVDSDGQKYLVMNKAMRRRLSAAARLYTVGGYITYELDAFGRQVTHYNDIPILIADQDNTGTDILGFTEAASSGGATATSIYCISVGDNSLTGIQNETIEAYDLGEIDASPVYRTRVEWASGIALYSARGAARLKFIGDLAVVA